MIGSCNSTNRRSRPFEADIATSDPKFAEEMRRDLFEADFERSEGLKELSPLTDGDRIAE